jgi:hypothetical protein
VGRGHREYDGTVVGTVTGSDGGDRDVTPRVLCAGPCVF